MTLYDYIDMGLVRDLSDVDPLDATLLRIVHNHFRSRKVL